MLTSLGGSDLCPPSRYRPLVGRGPKPRPPLPPPFLAAIPLPNRLLRSRLAGSPATWVDPVLDLSFAAAAPRDVLVKTTLTKTRPLSLP